MMMMMPKKLTDSELDEIKSRIGKCESVLKKGQDLFKESDILDKNCSELTNKASLIKLEPIKGMEEILRTESLLQIFKWMEAIEVLDVSLSQIFRNSQKKDLKQNIGNREALVSLYGRLNLFALRIRNSVCQNLKRFVLDSKNYWQKELSNYFNSSVRDTIFKLNWPNGVLESNSTEFSQTEFSSLLFEFDFLVELGENPIKEHLICPLKKRFKYHFSGSKKTNVSSKPEWFLRQVWKWIKDSEHFFEFYLSRSHQTKFVYELLKICNDKLHRHLEEVSDHSSLFSHSIDEILGLSRDLINEEYLPDSHDLCPANSLTEGQVFFKWIELEKKFAFEKLDIILLDENAWSRSLSVPSVSKCTVRFVALLQCMVDRYKLLSSWKQQYKFIQLQNELLEDMRLRFVQISRSVQHITEKYCIILNSSRHIYSTLESWMELPFFMKLQVLSDVRGVFSLSGFHFVLTEMSKSIGEFIFTEVKDQSARYLNSSIWLSIEEIDSDVSVEALPILQTLLSRLTFLKEKCDNQVFIEICEYTILEIKNLLVNDLVLNNKFSSKGGERLARDLIQGFLPLFGQYYIIKTDVLTELKEIAILMKLNEEQALLFCQSLSNKICIETTQKLSKLLEINHLKKNQILNILNRRIFNSHS